MGDVAVDDVLQGASLVMAIAYYQDFIGIHHSAYAYSEGLGGHLAQVAAEETAVGYDGVGGQGLDAGAGRERGTWLVESQMTVGTDSAHKQVDAAGCLYLLLIVLAFFLQVGGVAVEDMHVLGFDVYVGEEIVPHKGMVGLGMVDVEIDVLVHVECHDVLEGDFA